MNDNVPITHITHGQQEEGESFLHLPNLTPRNHVDALGRFLGGNTSIDTPLLKALDAAAALALVEPKSQDFSSSTKLPGSEVVLNSFDAPATTSNVHDGIAQTKLHSLPDCFSTVSPPSGHISRGIVAPQQVPFAFPPTNMGSIPPPTQSMTISLPAIAPVPMASSMKTSPPSVHPTLPDVVSASYQELRAAMKPPEIPPIFCDQPYRSGKWTKEEEIYADLLVELFHKGQVDEKNGSSLRAFLSRMLHCTPMRISKKYAGKGIGKMIYLSKNCVMGLYCHYGEDRIRTAEYQQNMLRLRHAEEAFYAKYRQETPNRLPSNKPGSGHSSIAAPLTKITSTTSTQPVPLLVRTTPLLVAPVPPQGKSAGFSSHPVAPAMPSSQSTLWQLPRQQLQASNHAVPGQYPKQAMIGMSVPPHVVGMPATGMPIPVQPPTIGIAARGIPIPLQPPTTGSSATIAIPMLPPTVPPVHVLINPSSAYTCLDQGYIGVAQTVPSLSTPPIVIMPTLPTAPAVSISSDQATNSSSVVSTIDYRRDNLPGKNDTVREENPRTGMSAPVPTVPELPDFLTGFDRVKKEVLLTAQQHHNTIVDDDPSQYSPTYTSKSFDDFHRLLGSNLSPGGQRQVVNLPNLSPSVENNAARDHMIPLAPAGGVVDGFNLNTHHLQSNTTPIKQAYQATPTIRHRTYEETGLPISSKPSDSYTIFAQQGAFAAYQHSTYFASKKDSDGDKISMLLMGVNQKANQKEASTSSPQIGWPSRSRPSPLSTGGNSDSFHTRYSRRPAPASVSAEPSDQGSDEANQSSVSDSNPTDGSNDSDGSYSLSNQKKARLATATDDDDDDEEEEIDESSLRAMMYG